MTYDSSIELTAMLRCIAAYHATHGISPSMRDLQDALGISSTAVVAYRLNKLQAQGHITRMPRLSRTIRLVHPLDAAETVSQHITSHSATGAKGTTRP